MYRQGYGNAGPAGGPGPSNPYGNPYGNAGFQNQPFQQPSNAYANDDSGKKGSGNDPLLTVIRWFKARSDKERSAVVGVSALMALVVFYFIIEDHDTLFVMSEVIHFIGIALLGYKLLKQRNSAGLSLGSQELTLIFLAIRMFCSFLMEYDVHTLLDLLSLGATSAVVYGLRGPLKATYQKEFDTMHVLVVMAPCLLLAVFVHPSTRHSFVLRVLWAFCVYLEAGVGAAAASYDAEERSCGEVYGTLRVCAGTEQVCGGKPLDIAAARGQQQPVPEDPDASVAGHGAHLGDCADGYPGRFLLDLRQEL